jgi:hypothetical protein
MQLSLVISTGVPLRVFPNLSLRLVWADILYEACRVVSLLYYCGWNLAKGVFLGFRYKKSRSGYRQLSLELLCGLRS